MRNVRRRLPVTLRLHVPLRSPVKICASRTATTSTRPGRPYRPERQTSCAACPPYRRRHPSRCLLRRASGCPCERSCESSSQTSVARNATLVKRTGRVPPPPGAPVLVFETWRRCPQPIAQSRKLKSPRTPQKPQQIRMSSHPTPENPHNSLLINHLTPKNSWHSSYAPLDTINIWIKSIKTREPALSAPSTHRKRFITDMLAVN